MYKCNLEYKQLENFPILSHAYSSIFPFKTGKQLQVMTLWPVACQAPLSMGFSRQEYWSGVAMPSSRGSSQPRGWTHVSYISCTGRWILYHFYILGSPSLSPYFSLNLLFYPPNYLHCFHSPTPHCIHRNLSKTKKSFFGSHNVWDQDNLFYSLKKKKDNLLYLLIQS